MFVSSWWYFQRCTLRNRIKALLGKLRQVKYVLGLLVTTAYFGWIFFYNPAFRANRSTPEQILDNTQVITAGFYALQVLLVWFTLSSGRGVAFREAEVQQLFPRPLTRWQILRFKWMNSQTAALIGSLLLGLMFNRFGGLSYPYVVAGFWINQSVFHANFTLVGLWLARLKAAGGLAARCTSLPAWLLLAALGGGAAIGWPMLHARHGFAAAHELIQTPVLAVVLWPLLRMVDPILTHDLASFGMAAIVPVLLFLGQALLVWWADFRFEDQAVEIAEKIQNIKSHGIGALASKQDLVVAKPRQPWQLAPVGPVWKALVWKNVISFGRLPRRFAVRIGIIVLILVFVIGRAVVTGGQDPDAATRIGFLLLGVMGYVTMLGSSLVRVDLRIDIPHFDVLKAMPLRGRSLIFGEIMGTVSVLWAFQLIGCIAAALLITREGQNTFGWVDKAPALIGALCVFFAIDFVLVTSENLMALWLPGFVRLGRGIRTGFDQIGQNLMGALARMLVLVLMLITPGFLGALAGYLGCLLGLPLMTSIAQAAVLFAALVFAEGWVMILLSEGRYERFDITSENITTDAD